MQMLKYGGSMEVKTAKPIDNQAALQPEQKRSSAQIMQEMRLKNQAHPFDLTHRNHQTPMGYHSNLKTVKQSDLHKQLMNESTGHSSSDPPHIKKMIYDMFDQYPRLKAVYQSGRYQPEKEVYRRPQQRSQPRGILFIDNHDDIMTPVRFGNGKPISNYHQATHEFHYV